MNGQCGVVPGRSIRELVVGQHVSSGLRLAQVLEPDDRDFGASIEFRRLVAAMAGDDLLGPVDQNRRVEAEGGDTAGDRTNSNPLRSSGANRLEITSSGTMAMTSLRRIVRPAGENR